jgi:hypothetical protein
VSYQNNTSHQEQYEVLVWELQSGILTVPKSDFPVAASPPTTREDFPLPAQKEKS